MKLLLQSLASICLLVCSACWADDLDANWLDHGEQLTDAQLSRVTNLMRADSETNIILEKAIVLSGGDLSNLVKACGPEVLGRSRGLTIPLPGTGVKFSSLANDVEVLFDGSPQERFKVKIDGLVEKSKSKRINPRFGTYYFFLAIIGDFKICLSPKLSVEEAFGVLVHELTHYVQRNWGYFDVLKYADSREYFEKVLQEPGEEVDAFIAEYRALIRLKKNRLSLPRSIRGLFNDSGDFIGSRKEFALIILDPTLEFQYATDRFAVREQRDRTTGEVYKADPYVKFFNDYYQVEMEERNEVARWLTLSRKRLSNGKKMAAIQSGETLAATMLLVERYKTVIDSLSEDLAARDLRLSEFEARIAAASGAVESVEPTEF